MKSDIISYYDRLVKTCAVHANFPAVYSRHDRRWRTLSYSELYGVCEYVAQNLRLLDATSGVVCVITTLLAVVPAIIAAVHKDFPSFILLDATNDNKAILEFIKFSVIVTVSNKDEVFDFDRRKPDRELSLFDVVVKLYKNAADKCFHISENERSFIVATSGSTGLPKLVKVPTSCIQPNADDFIKLFDISKADVVYFSTPLTFDPSMIELLIAYSTGASLLIAQASTDLTANGPSPSITIWQITPSRFFQFSDTEISQILGPDSTLKVLAFGGEPLHHVQRLKKLKHRDNKTRIFSLYGVTEVSCWACIVELKLDLMEDDNVPIGNCLSKTLLRLSLSNQDSLGTILLGSSSRKCTILNKASPYENIENVQWINTGDLAEQRDNAVYFIGRTDNIIKRFGSRVNVLQIEVMAMHCSEVKSCSCIWLQDAHLLILYYTSDTLSNDGLAEFLRKCLDDKHQPDKIIQIASMPLNNNGKISKHALTELKLPNTLDTFDQLKSTILKELKSTLKHDCTYDDIKDKDYFALGGTSFTAIAMCNKVAAYFPQHNFSSLYSLLKPNTSIERVFKELYSKLYDKSIMPQKKKNRKLSTKLAKKKPKRKLVLNEDTPGSIIELWSYDTEKCIDASPTIYKGPKNYFVTVGSHSGKIIVVNIQSGSLVGHIHVKSRIEAPVLCYDETDPHGVVGAYDGTITCFSLETCDVTWETNVCAMIKSKAALVENRLYVASYDGIVRCISILNGDTVNELPVSNDGICADLVSTRKNLLLVATLGGVCVCVNTNTQSVIWSQSLGSPIFAAPALFNEETCVVFAEVKGVVHCLSVEYGTKMWSYSRVYGNIFSSMLPIKCITADWDIVFGCHDCNVYCLSISTEQSTDHTVRLKWKTKNTSAVYSTPCYFPNNYVLFFTVEGKLIVIDNNDGKILKGYSIPGEVFSSPVILQNQIFVGCRDDHLYALKLVI